MQGSHHKAWRKIAKKLRRKRIRQKLAKERDDKIEAENAKLKLDPAYQQWLTDQETLEKFREEVEQREHDEQEELWMRRELLAQKKFRQEKKRQEAAEKAKEEERQRIQKEFEEQQKIVQQRIAEKKRLAEEKQRRHELLQQRIKEYINEGGELPQELYESADTNPGKELCPFFMKTASCRFGDRCTRNHSRPCVSRILLLPYFFTHIRLEQPAHSEYGSDLSLEFSEAELYQAYDDFFEDVTTELSKYGSIVNFRVCRNSEPHLRGNVFVEFEDDRSSLRAYQVLQGRYYAGKRINVEFCKLVSWKAAICGLSLSRTCPKGANCNYLHIFRNPGNKYNTRDPLTERSSRRNNVEGSTPSTHIRSWNDDISSSRRDWRWSESPEHPAGISETHRPQSRRRSRSRSHERRRKSNQNEYRRRSQSRENIQCRRSRSKNSSRDSHDKSRHRRRSRSKSSSSKLSEVKDRNEMQSNENYKKSQRSRSKSKEKRKRKRRKRSKSKSRHK
ncbi:unnamed protein product [Hermetia illucens]|uniref:Uncharacterized protein n=1 Tax=Hermetia illucens TaxID=343691 RepID=A0A7R8YRX5_HERIL|nr:U2 small nuclear ribonucleoprotein auxiliary factor 35 kDa subunit-related protein 1 [Hermetia illucens]CAD7079949.1 unnamed protein product [Hermetia illucens]